ncbi:hypothetical protein LTR16_000801 [Cryomyces antarcticus]|uniref:DUF4048 domain-containing protein n=1 Tax=Cryomyces antarcticus TaxID=329879 RepID=A0ABR0LZQ9_9PEZI|nr:hypothetical protein LTR39_000513 [Cryomyces antarcticus]KAK5020601.1 hypothetical protein LTR60_000371 [Cryomyces antarcticus]KAK5257393.1 hypothetical protein LTR16_000801 [Cryomyces antarcticus]
MNSSTSPSKPFQSHSRSMSLTESPQKKNRSSMSFPVQATRNASPQRQAPAPSHIDNLKVALGNTASPPGPTDTCFLIALAAQERRVLELKEELHRAELDLQKLKKRWASHEATTKRNGVLRVQQLRPLETATLNVEYTVDDSDGSSAWIQKEMERRKALLSGAKSSHRKVFSGSRNTRALSLLSPDKATSNSPCPQRIQDRTKRPSPISWTSTTSDLTAELADALYDSNDDRSLPREDLLRTGRQMATVFKDGLWTFIEDLRQATVGDEGVHGTQSRPPQSALNVANRRKVAGRPSSRSSANATGGRPTMTKTSSSSGLPIRPAMQTRPSGDLPLTDIGGSFWKENGLGTPKPAAAPKITKATKLSPSPRKSSHRPTNSIGSWDAWDDSAQDTDSAQSSSRTSISEGRTSVATDSSSRRTSTSSNDDTPRQRDSTNADKRESIPWPALAKLSPSVLKRTASHLMSEWERSSSPSPDEQDVQEKHGTVSSLRTEGVNAEGRGISTILERR